MSARVWPLLVVSSENQRESLDDYLAMARADAEKNGWTLERIGDFRDVASGKDGPRKTTLKLVAELAATDPADRPAWIWMRRTDRVGRGRATESMLALYAIHDLGPRIWDHDSGEVKLDTAEDELPAMLKAWFGRLENQVRRGKALAFFEKRRKANLPLSNQRPLGLRRGADGRDEPDEPFAEVIRTLFRLRLNGTPQRPGAMGLGSVARELLAITPRFTFKNGRSIDVRWSAARVRKVLEQRAYVEAGVVDEITFVRAQRPGVTPRRGATRPLAGALTCSCGKTLTSTTWGRTPRRIPYYVCRAAWNHGKLEVGHREDRLVLQFVALLDRLAASPELVAEYSRSARTVSTDLVERALREAQVALAGFARERDRIWALNAAGKLRDDDLQPRLDDLAARRAQTEARIGELTTQAAIAQHEQRREDDARELVAEAAAIWAASDVAHQRRIAREVAATLGGLVVEPDGSLVIRTAVDPGRQKRPRRSAAE